MPTANAKAVGLVNSLLEYAGIDPEGFEETNKALISIDHEATVLIVVEGRLIHLIGVLGAPIATAELCTSLMQENFKSVAQARYRYCLEPESGELLMSHTLQSDNLDTAAFVDVFVEMADYTRKWSRSLASGSADVPKPDHRPADASQRTRSGIDELAARAKTDFLKA